MDENWLETIKRLSTKYNWDKTEPIEGQLSFFPADKSSFLKSSEEKLNFNSFEDIIYKNPSFTVEDMERYQSLSEEMTDA